MLTPTLAFAFNDFTEFSALMQAQLAFTSPRDEMSEMVFFYRQHRQLGENNLSKIATQWLGSESNLQP